uniref:Uncharacterized protein n=1 Tax=Rhizophora mucronata TaxID=61149 RepID=A0A2P2QPH8_RHIMU
MSSGGSIDLKLSALEATSPFLLVPNFEDPTFLLAGAPGTGFLPVSMLTADFLTNDPSDATTEGLLPPTV